MLRKGGTDDPLDLRPVALLPAVYRLWARARAPDLRSWLTAVGVQPLLGPAKGAEEHGLLPALQLEEARLEGDAFAAVAYDLSKAYDRTPLGYFEA